MPITAARLKRLWNARKDDQTLEEFVVSLRDGFDIHDAADLENLWAACKDDKTLGAFINDLEDSFDIHDTHDFRNLWLACKDDITLKNFVVQIGLLDNAFDIHEDQDIINLWTAYIQVIAKKAGVDFHSGSIDEDAYNAAFHDIRNIRDFIVDLGDNLDVHDTIDLKHLWAIFCSYKDENLKDFIDVLDDNFDIHDAGDLRNLRAACKDYSKATAQIRGLLNSGGSNAASSSTTPAPRKISAPPVPQRVIGQSSSRSSSRILQSRLIPRDDQDLIIPPPPPLDDDVPPPPPLPKEKGFWAALFTGSSSSSSSSSPQPSKPPTVTSVGTEQGTQNFPEVLRKIMDNSIKIIEVANLSAGDTQVATSQTSEHCLSITYDCHSCVSALTVIADGSLVSGDLDNSVKIWDTRAGRCLKGHSGSVYALAVLPEGRLASGSDDDSIKIWDLRSRSCIFTLEGHSNSVNALAVLPDGRLASGSKDNSIKIWDLRSRSCLCTLEGHSNSVNALAVLPEGRLASGSVDNSIKIWDLRSRSCIFTLEGHSNNVNVLAVLPKGRLASGSCEEHSIKIWDIGCTLRNLNTGELRQLFFALQTNLSVQKLDVTSVNLDGTEDVLADLVSERPQLNLIPRASEIPNLTAFMQKWNAGYDAQVATKAKQLTKFEREKTEKERLDKEAQERAKTSTSGMQGRSKLLTGEDVAIANQRLAREAVERKRSVTTVQTPPSSSPSPSLPSAIVSSSSVRSVGKMVSSRITMFQTSPSGSAQSSLSRPVITASIAVPIIPTKPIIVHTPQILAVPAKPSPVLPSSSPSSIPYPAAAAPSRLPARPMDKQAIVEVETLLNKAYPDDGSEDTGQFRAGILSWLATYRNRALNAGERNELKQKATEMQVVLEPEERASPK